MFFPSGLLPKRFLPVMLLSLFLASCAGPVEGEGVAGKWMVLDEGRNGGYMDFAEDGNWSDGKHTGTWAQTADDYLEIDVNFNGKQLLMGFKFAGSGNNMSLNLHKVNGSASGAYDMVNAGAFPATMSMKRTR
ncbi:hypothetical protein KDL44_13925 [bacterium]|nr:hypothetical protein [bacterium]